MVQERDFFENLFSQRKKVGLGLSVVVMIYKNVLDNNHELYFNLVLLWKIKLFWKVITWDELRRILKIILIGLWNVYVYATALICELCVYLVETFELSYFDFGGKLKNASFYKHRRT